MYEIPTIVLTAVGVFSPFLIKVIVKAFKERWLKFLISMLLSGIMGLVCVIVLKLPLALEQLEVTLPAFFALSQLCYSTVWHKILKD